jgi:hypothetical protein
MNNTLRTRQITNEITLPSDMLLRVATHPEGRTFLQIYKEGICNRTGEPYREGGRKWDVSIHATESEIVLTVFKAILTFAEHELREQFEYKGFKILDPHTDVNSLIFACQQRDLRHEKV